MTTTNTTQPLFLVARDAEGDTYAVACPDGASGDAILTALADLMQLDAPTKCATWYVRARDAGAARLLPPETTTGFIGVRYLTIGVAS